ncbi:RNA-binding protein NOB1 isoform X1 [Olea europaea var. sylvestris]|uniref:RNA-binding protein NOB1 isoform X1 n=1 Tax=Olea europaea var. sylvestris TaxID=158386 RepID=UPI000C1D08D7|nr:RNA-binding protein NOB1 isoform X1 [Olea europaea var. sylvestris]
MEVQSQPLAQPLWSNILKQQPKNPPPAPQLFSPIINDQQHGVMVGSCDSRKGISVAVVDANAIIQGGERLCLSADRFVSVPEVIAEIRDPASRHSLKFLPFSVDTLEPSSDALRKVINFARATGDLQTLSDVDLKLIALTYTLEAQTHGTHHIRDNPPPIQTVNVKRLPEKDMPGWGSNVPNLEEWETLEHATEGGSIPNSRILPMKNLNLNALSADEHGTENGSIQNGSESQSGNQENADGGFTKPRRYFQQKKEINIDGKKMVADGIDASQGHYDDESGDWMPAVSRSTHRRFLRRKARREIHAELSAKSDQQDAAENESENLDDDNCCPDLIPVQSYEETGNSSLGNGKIIDGKNTDEDISEILNNMRLEEESLKSVAEGEDSDVEVGDEGPEFPETTSQTSENVDALHMDDNSSEQSWTLRSLSESSVACVTTDFAMQNVLLQMGLRLVAPGGMQIRELHRWVLKCHACNKLTTEIGRIFCPKCGNGGTLRKVAVTVGENGIVLAARRPRVSLRGTKFSLPLPQGGRAAITKNPVLREDQLPQKFLYPKTKKKNKQGDDIFAPDDLFLTHTSKKAPLQPPVRKTLAVFSQKRNPNDNHYSRAKH